MMFDKKIVTFIFAATMVLPCITFAQMGESTEGLRDLQPSEEKPVEKKTEKPQKKQTVSKKVTQQKKSSEVQQTTQITQGQSWFSLDQGQSVIDYRDVLDLINQSSKKDQKIHHLEIENEKLYLYVHQKDLGDGKVALVRDLHIDFVDPHWGKIFFEHIKKFEKVSLLTPSFVSSRTHLSNVKVVIHDTQQVYYLPSLLAELAPDYQEAGFPVSESRFLQKEYDKHISTIAYAFDDQEQEKMQHFARYYSQTSKIAQAAKLQVDEVRFWWEWSCSREIGLLLTDECNGSVVWNEFLEGLFFVEVSSLQKQKTTQTYSIR